MGVGGCELATSEEAVEAQCDATHKAGLSGDWGVNRGAVGEGHPDG